MTRTSLPKHSASLSRPPKFVARSPTLANGRLRISRLLIANRGEIACRIVSTCKALGITSIAIYTDEDRESLHVEAADEAICLGSIQQSAGNPHQNGKLIIEAALSNQVDAIHPGYGYLSENAKFAKEVREAGIMFVGPSSHAISILGDKRQAKEFLQKNAPNVPLVPGYHGTAQDVDTLQAAADDIGFPVMIKAAAGGGGRGMRIVYDKISFAEQLSSAQSEANSSFGSRDCILEKYIARNKHIEVQIMGDSTGVIISLDDRECTIQRRHQKIIEEAPSMWFSQFPKVRQRMIDTAIVISKILGYESAGTVEFIVDVESAKFYFLEINTRIQVEHAITEETTGIDIVALQLFIAGGGRFSEYPILQNPAQYGHSIECRLCAEDPANNFMPESGLVLRWTPGTDLLDSQQNESVRVETAIRTGSNVTVHFDSMIAKIIVWAVDRASAIAKMINVLKHTICVGIKTNHLFLQACLAHPAFNQVDYSNIIPGFMCELLLNPYSDDIAHWHKALCYVPALFTRSVAGSTISQASFQPFGSIRRGFRNQIHDQSNQLSDVVLVETTNYLVTWSARRESSKDTYYYQAQEFADSAIRQTNRVSDGDPGTQLARHFNDIFIPLQQRADHSPIYEKVRIIESDCKLHRSHDSSNRQWLLGTIVVETANRRQTLHLTSSPASPSSNIGVPQRIFVQVPSLGTSIEYFRHTLLSYGESQRIHFQDNQAMDAVRMYKSVMPCKVLRLLKKTGDQVRSGETMLVVESMKTEVKVVAAVDGTFESKVKEGDAVGDDVLLCELLEIEPQE